MPKSKLITVALSFVLILSVLLAGCKGGKNHDDETTNASEQVIQATQKQTEPQTASTAKEIQVVDLFSQSGKCYPNGIGSFEYSYSIPHLEDDSADAERINDSIEEAYLTLANEQLKLVENNELPNCLRIEWSIERSERTLSIIICAANGFSFMEYDVYCYDTQSQKWLTKEDFLEMFSFSQEEYISRVVAAAEEFFVEQNNEIPENERNEYGYYEVFDRIPQYITFNDTMPYLGSDGGLKVVAPVPSLVGGDEWYYFVLDVSLDAVG